MNTHYGNNLKLIRELHNYTQQYVAKAISCCDKTYRELEHSEKCPSPYYISLLSQFYKKDVSNFIHHTQEEIVKRLLEWK